MEYRIKQGEDLTCSYTGKPSRVLIQLIDTEGRATEYLSREALLNANKLLMALEGIQEPMMPHMPLPNYTQTPYPGLQQPPVYNPVITSNNSSDNANLIGQMPVEKKIPIPANPALKSFEMACVALCQDPPADKNGNQSGVPGFAIRELVEKWKPQFPNVKEMYPIIQKYFPSPKEVIDFMLGI